MISETEREPALHDQVLVETRIDDQAIGFRAIVVNVKPGALWLGLARPDARLERLEANQPVHLTFRRDAGALIADSTFRAHLGSNRSRLFAVDRPAELQLVQRRAHLRLDVEHPIEVRVVSQSSSGAAGRSGSGTTRNMSAGGLQFATEMMLAAGDELEVTVILGPNDFVPAEAQVVRVEEAQDDWPDVPVRPLALAGPPRRFVAVRFLAISEVAQDRIVRHIFSTQRQRRDDPRRAATG